MNNGLSNYGGFYASNGYVGSRMSVRAWEAYEDGEKPISYWTKKVILQRLKEEVVNIEPIKFYKRCSKVFFD